MTKVKCWPFSILLMLLGNLPCFAQSGYTVSYTVADSVEESGADTLRQHFTSLQAASLYIIQLPVQLRNRGYITASLDSVRYDSLGAHVQLYYGIRYRWTKLATHAKDADVLSAIRWNTADFENRPVRFSEMEARQRQILDHLQDAGFPFARVYLDSFTLTGTDLQAQLQVVRGPLYAVDSIRVFGDAKVSNLFLQRYLDIPEGSRYSKDKLDKVDKKIAALAFLESEKPSDLTLSGSGAVLNLYLKGLRNSQVNALLGFLPNPVPSSPGAPAKRFRISGEANILLRNALASGETIGVNAQWLQAGSPRLNLLYEQPYLFRSPYGLLFHFDMFRKDSTFLNINFRLGANYGLGGVQSSSIFIQRSQSLLSGIDTGQVMRNRRLPAEADVSATSLGMGYDLNNTDYRLNPQKGNELLLTASAGTKRVKKNTQVIALKDPGDPAFNYERLYDTVKLKTFQVRFAGSAAHYFKTGRQTTFKTGVQGGIFGSGSIYRNEAFRIGGYRLLRGFDEESQFVSRYAIGTLEYRVLLQRASNFFAFVDGGAGRSLDLQTHTYLGTGLGISSETGAGIFNLVWAIGKRNDTEFNLRQSKVHLGFINYF